MDVVIHTYGRATKARQHTLRALLAEDIQPWLAVQAREADQYLWYDGPKIIVPPHITTLSPTRDWLIHEAPLADDHIVFLDDDLHFFVRRDDDRTKFRSPQNGELGAMLGRMDASLCLHPHVGIATREGGNRNTEPFLANTRIMRVLGYRKSYLRERRITFAPLVVMEDFHVNLQVLKSGADTLVLNDWCSNQAEGSDAPGGCSSYRSAQVQADSANLLSTLHAPYVRVVEKETKIAWGGGTRTDVVVSWKKARNHATLCT